MTGEQIGRRGRAVAAVGTGLVAWVVVAAALAEVGNPRVLVAIAVSGGLVCLCAVAGGVVATRIIDAASAARVRHVFVVLEGTAMALFFPFYWFGLGVEPAQGSGVFALGFVLVITVPVGISLLLAVLSSRAVHMLVVDAFGPIVPDSGSGAPAQRIRLLGTVLVTVGGALSAGALAVAFTASSDWLLLEVIGLGVTFTPVVLGVLLTRVTDVHSARQRNVGMYLILPGASGFAVSKFGSVGGVEGMLFGALVFGAIVLLVIALVVLREYTGQWDRPWRVLKRTVSR